MQSAPEIHYLVEGDTDAAVARRLIHACGALPGMERVTRGRARFAANLPKYNAAAAHYPWLAIRDLDHDADCAPALVQAALPNVSPLMCFRVAVREAEAWLLGDREVLARALGVSTSRVPDQPEMISDPKLTIVNLARHSKKRAVRDGLVPAKGSGIAIGPEYAAWIIDFVQSDWDPLRAIAGKGVPSLERAFRAVQRLAQSAIENLDTRR
jgi:hypothetical protein